MRASIIILTTIAAVAVNGYKVDPNLPDGVYFIPVLNVTKGGGFSKFFGKPIRLDDDIDDSQTTDDGKLERDIVGEIPVPADSHSCYDATESVGDHHGAHKILSAKCNNGRLVPAWHDLQSGIILARYASSLAFVCNWSGNRQQCAPNEIDDSYRQIKDNCHGQFRSGHICASAWKKCYGHSTVVHEICDNDV